jgi:integrase
LTEEQPTNTEWKKAVSDAVRKETRRFTIRQPWHYISTSQYVRLLANWTTSVGLDPRIFGTHSLRRTKAALIYRRTGNLRAVQLLLGHTKIESTVRYLGIEVDDALGHFRKDKSLRQ